MRKALFLRPFRIVERRKGLVCSSVGRPMSPNTRDPISELSKKSEIGVTKNEKNGRKNAIIDAFTTKPVK